jgi:hypothetical protein
MNIQTIIITVTVILSTLFSSNLSAQNNLDSTAKKIGKRYSIATNLTQLSTIVIPDAGLGTGIVRRKTDFYLHYYLSKQFCLSSNLGYAKLSKMYNYAYQFESQGFFWQLGVAKRFSKGSPISGLLGYNLGISAYRIIHYQKFIEDFWGPEYEIKVVNDRLRYYHELFATGRYTFVDKPKFGLFFELVAKFRFTTYKTKNLENREFIPGFGRYIEGGIMPAAAINFGVDF